MSNSWRGPKSELAKPSPRPMDEDAASSPKDNKPVVSAKPQAAAKARQPESPVPEARRKRDSNSTRPAPKRSIDLAKVTQAISAGVSWLGGVTLQAAAFVQERSRPALKRIKPWITRGREGQLPRQTVVVGFTGLTFLLMFIFWINRDGTIQTPALTQPNYSVGDTNIDALKGVGQAFQPDRSKDAGNAEGSRNHHGKGDRVGSQPGKADLRDGAPDAQPKPKLSRVAIDPREKGKRYYTLATYSVNKEAYLMPLLEYLWSQGVEAAAINSHNSGFFQVVALQGFTRDEINQKAHKQYEDALRRIGRKWKAEGGGDDNLQGLYLQEYAGAQAKLSITKAN